MDKQLAPAVSQRKREDVQPKVTGSRVKKKKGATADGNLLSNDKAVTAASPEKRGKTGKG